MFHAEILAQELLFLHGLSQKDWKFQFDRAKKRFGMCNYTTKIISLSKYLTEINSEEKVTETLLHEIAHALAGHNAGHGKIWKEKMIELGQKPERCYGNEVITPKLKYTGRCKNFKICKTEIQRKTLPKNTFLKQKKIACKKCCKQFNNNKFSEDFIFEFVEN
jgi:predicted SprT family Zn-dependent metalloprotease